MAYINIYEVDCDNNSGISIKANKKSSDLQRKSNLTKNKVLKKKQKTLEKENSGNITVSCSQENKSSKVAIYDSEPITSSHYYK